MNSPASPRPRVVEIAFWLLILAALALIMSGLLVAFSASPIPVFFRAAGGLFAVSGGALAYLVGRARRGDDRFRRATVGLTFPLIVLLTLFMLTSRGMAWLLIMVLVVAGTILLLRPGATAWFSAE